MKNIAAAYVKAKRAFGPALKDKTNPAFRSKYADLGACIDAVEDALLDNGIAFFQETFEDATGVTVETVFMHESGEVMRCGKLHVPAAKQDPQGYGSALTYCRRYSLMAACGIAPEDDDGQAASKPRALPANLKITPTDGAMDRLENDEHRAYIRELAMKVKEQFPLSVAQTFDRIETEKLDNDQKVALWSLLPSDIRSALKRETASRTEKAAA